MSILLLLRTRGRVPARELADRLEVSLRTIYRDVEALSAAGVPVYAERGRHGGIELLAGFRTDVTGLTANESRALFILATEGAHAALGLDAAFSSALRKVMAALPIPHQSAAEATARRILVDATRWRRGPQSAVDLNTLQDAIFADKRLRLEYRHSGTTDTRLYIVDPYGLVFKAGIWYLVADLAGRPRLFRADRVRSACVLDDPVQRRPGVELAHAWDALRRQVEERPGKVDVAVLVQREILDLFQRLLASWLTTLPDDDGTNDRITVHLTFGNLGESRQLLMFGNEVEVISPPEVREELTSSAAAVTELYGSPGSTTQT
ncbi:helix-turn-helix transcriptional regulator [Nocardia sp. R16R-3T]